MKNCSIVPILGMAISLALPSFSQDQKAVDPEVRQQIEALFTKFREAFNKHDPSAVAALYTGNAMRSDSYGPDVDVGQQAIQKSYADMLSSMPGELVGKVVEVYPIGNDMCVITKDSEGAQWKGYKTWICNRDAEPTVLLNTTSAMSVEREEIFGPVVCAIPFDSADEIPAVANQTRYGLAASIWTRDFSKALRLAKSLNVGGVWVNCCDVFDPNFPWGGFKQSGWGRELGPEGVETFTELKAITVKL